MSGDFCGLLLEGGGIGTEISCILLQNLKYTVFFCLLNIHLWSEVIAVFCAMCMIADKQVSRQWKKQENENELVGREARTQGVLQQIFSQTGREGLRTAVFSLKGFVTVWTPEIQRHFLHCLANIMCYLCACICLLTNNCVSHPACRRT